MPIPAKNFCAIFAVSAGGGGKQQWDDQSRSPTTKAKTMKRSNLIPTQLTRSLAVAVLAGLVWFPAQSFAQSKGAGAANLIQLKPIKTVADAEAVAPGDTVVMSCPKCKDSWLTIVQAPLKQGAAPETKTVLRHECPGCEHKYVTEGHGKAKTDKLVHVCKNCGSEDAFCCVMKKGSTTPTPGMEKK
jgi:hypothetical protein